MFTAHCFCFCNFSKNLIYAKARETLSGQWVCLSKVKQPGILVLTGISLFEHLHSKSFLQSTSMTLIIINPLHSRVALNKLTSVFYASVLLLIMNCVITLSK